MRSASVMLSLLLYLCDRGRCQHQPGRVVVAQPPQVERRGRLAGVAHRTAIQPPPAWDGQDRPHCNAGAAHLAAGGHGCTAVTVTSTRGLAASSWR